MGAILESEKKQEVKTSSEKVQISSFTGDYEYFLKGYLFRLLGVAKDIDLVHVSQTRGKEYPPVSKKNGRIFFSASKKQYFSIDEKDIPFSDEDSIALASNIIGAFLLCSEYKYSNETEVYNHYKLCTQLHDLSFQNRLVVHSVLCFGDLAVEQVFCDLK